MKKIDVKIIKCPNPAAWYSTELGKIFSVVEHESESSFYVVAQDFTEDSRRLITRDNCEVIDDKTIFHSS